MKTPATTDLEGLPKNCLQALEKEGITNLEELTEKTWEELQNNETIGKNEILAVLLDFVQNVKKRDFRKA